jgi:hypothetical protein
MTTLVRGAHPDDIESIRVEPLTWGARQARVASIPTLANGVASGGLRGNGERVRRTAQLTRAIDFRIDVLEDFNPTAVEEEAPHVA